MSKDFGKTLRWARKQRGLTQGQLGGTGMSGSYVSLLETGRRSPTNEVITHLARQLDVSPSEVRSWIPESVDGAGDVAAAASPVWESMRLRDYETAVIAAESAMRAALAQGNRAMWWTLAYEKTRALLLAKRYSECLVEARRLRASTISQGQSNLAVRAAIFHSAAARATGAISEAVQAALDAVRGRESEPDHEHLSVEALLVAISALSDCGRLEDALPFRNRLVSVLGQIAEDQTRGRAAWALGNVDFRLGRVAAGTSLHEVAAKSQTPEAGFELWSRVNLTAAAERLDCGLADDLTLEFLENASKGYGILESPGVDVKIAFYNATYLAIEGRWEEALAIAEEFADRVPELADENMSGKYSALMARCFGMLGRMADQHQYERTAAHHFMAAGAK